MIFMMNKKIYIIQKIFNILLFKVRNPYKQIVEIVVNHKTEQFIFSITYIVNLKNNKNYK